MLEIGSLVDGKYRVLNKCGQGGMSVVYMAMNERANKTWAIKEVCKDGVQNFDVVKQGLIVETDLLKRLNHPNLPSIVDVIDGDGSFLIVMDYIEGKTLKDVLKEYGPQPQESVIDWAKQLCDVLGYLHSRKPPIIYRDMKPSNVMLKPDGSIVLFDFGTAREYKISSMEDTTCLGTRGYAAPEQYGGHGQTDPRTDIYCLGATMYHLVTGHNPGEPPYEMYPIRQWNPNLSAGLENIILKCTQANPADRYQSCAELLYDLENYQMVDTRVRAKMLSKFRKFAVTAVLAAACGVGALSFHILEQSESNNTYDTYIDNAEKSSGEQKIDYLRQAINLEPTKEEAWNLLESEYESDLVFYSDEDQELQSIMMTTGSNRNKSNIDMFQSGNSDAYEAFCYKVGLLYYYYLESGNGKAQAATYFEEVKDSDSLKESDKESDLEMVAKAERLYEISKYYTQLGTEDKAGEQVISYQEYWDDLTELSAGNLVELTNKQTALVMYQEQVSQMMLYTTEFKDAGVTEDDMLDQIANMEEHLDSDFGDDLSTAQKNSMETLKSTIEQAKTVISSTYKTVGNQ
ncbi:MAG: serine/threonine protein kinase [Lachnospiraceae bacterium]|nr:serine/threonine protein kinase [Lachnospiraceae bacterium]